MKKILIHSPFIPYPLSHGGAVAQYFFLESMKEDFDVTYVAVCNSDMDLVNVSILKEELSHIKIETVNNLKLKPWYYVLFKYKIIKFIYKFVKFLLKRGMGSSTQDKRDLFHQSAPDKQLLLVLNKLLEQESFDLIQLEFFQSLELIKHLKFSCPAVFVAHELAFKRAEMEKKSVAYTEALKIYEIETMNRFNRIIVFNSNDLILLKNQVKSVELSPFGIPKKLVRKLDASNSFDAFLFVGSERHRPNREGLEWFLDEIYIPMYSEVWPIEITGNWSLRFKWKYFKYSKIKFTGFVESMDSLYEGKILISPILSGSGIRTKILEAFVNYIPVCSTAFGAEGLYESGHSKHLLLFETKKEFESIFRKLRARKLLLADIANDAMEFYKGNFSNEYLSSLRLKACNDL